MKVWIVSLVMIGFSVFSSGCGKSQGRDSGLAVENAVEVAPIAPTEMEIENVFGKTAPTIASYQVLGAFESRKLPMALRTTESGTVIGTLDVNVESRIYPAVSEEDPKPQIVNGVISTKANVIAFWNPKASNQWIFAIESNEKNAFYQNQNETVEVKSHPVNNCVQYHLTNQPMKFLYSTYVVTFDVKCDANTSICTTECKEAAIGLGGQTFPRSKLLELNPEAHCEKATPHYTQKHLVINSVQVKHATVWLKEPFNSEVRAISFLPQ